MNVRKLLTDNMPVILTSMAITGVLSTTVIAVRATPKALRDIQEAQSEHDRVLTKLEKVKLTWQYYIPASVVGIATIAAIVGVNSIHTKRQAVLAGLYTLSERAYSEYRDKVVETIGEKKDKALRDEIADERIQNNPANTTEIIFTGTGNHLCYDSLSGNYFESSIEVVRSAQNTINAQCINDMYASQNDFYRLIGLPINGYGEEVGWRTDNMMDISFSSVLEPTTGRPALSLDYRNHPIRGYYKHQQ